MGRVNVLAVSTFNAEGLALYGRRMMESFRQNWPIPLRVYSEGWEGDVDLLAASPWLADFKARHAGRAFRDFRWDAVRFAHKVAAVCHAAREDIDYLIWVDGDTFTHSPVTMADLRKMLPEGGQWIAWLDRTMAYPECGFFVLNCKHPQHERLIGTFEAMYAEDRLFSLPEFHDSYVLEQVVKASGVATMSLSGAARKTSHPAINGPLGAFIDHMKGQRKTSGRTPARERVMPGGGAYWS